MSRPFGWDLPPGCSQNDIPGNRPQDLREEAFWDTLINRVEHDFLPVPGDNEEERWFENENLCKLIAIARDLAFHEGYESGAADQQMEYAMREDAKAREEWEKRERES